jgi:hypothetical protein
MCGRVGYDALSEGAAGADADILPEEFESFEQPAMVDDFVATNAHDDDPTLSYDLLELYFTRRTDKGEHIWVATRDSVDASWRAPQRVESLVGDGKSNGAVLSSDALTIWFSSTRTGSYGNTDIWTATRASRDAAWSPATHVRELSGGGFELGSAVFDNDLQFIFNASPTLSEARVLYHSSRTSTSSNWSEPRVITELMSDGGERNATVSQNGLEIFFTSKRTGASDLYTSTRASQDDAWGEPQLDTVLSTTGKEDDPFLSSDQHHMVFARVVDGNWRIFWAER